MAKLGLLWLWNFFLASRTRFCKVLLSLFCLIANLGSVKFITAVINNCAHLCHKHDVKFLSWEKVNPRSEVQNRPQKVLQGVIKAINILHPILKRILSTIVLTLLYNPG